jgi:hypothetical protein
MSLLDAIRRQLLGQAAMMQPVQGMGGATQGLLGQGGQMGGGLLQSNLSQMNQGEGGLLSNIPQAAGFKGTLEQWNELKLSNRNVSDEDLIEFFNKKYGR